MPNRGMESCHSSDRAESEQLSLLRDGLSRLTCPGYPELRQRLVRVPSSFIVDNDGRIIVPDGSWTVNQHPNRTDNETTPVLATQALLTKQGLSLDALGRPLHPWFAQMVSDPGIGVVTGKGFYRQWGPNQTADAIVWQDGRVLLVMRRDCGQWAFPGGFVDPAESGLTAALRELGEESAVAIPSQSPNIRFYHGPVADIRLTANAWPVTTAYLFKVDARARLSLPKGSEETLRAQWFDFETVNLEFNLFGAHNYLAKLAIRQLTN